MMRRVSAVSPCGACSTQTVTTPTTTAASSSSLASLPLQHQSRSIAIPKQLAAYSGTFSRSKGGRSDNIVLGSTVLEDIKALDRQNNVFRRTKMKDDFREMGLERSVRQALEEGLKIREPSPIQQLVIDVGTSNRSSALKAHAPTTMLMEHADVAEGNTVSLDGNVTDGLTASAPMRTIAQKVSSDLERFGATGSGSAATPGMSGVIAVAPPGTGKTVACLAPAYSNMVKDRDHYHLPVREFRPRMLVLSTTQDLLRQHQNVCKKFDETTGLRSAVITRATRMKRKISQILRGSVPSNKRRLAREAKKNLIEVNEQLETGNSSPELLARKAALQATIDAGVSKPPVDVLVIHPHMVLRLLRAKRLFLDDLRYVVVDEADSLLSKDHDYTTQQLISKIEKRNLNRHLFPVQTQFYFSSFGVTRKLSQYLEKHFPHATHCYDPKANQAPNTEGIRYKFIQVDKESEKMDMLEFLLNKKTLNYPRNQFTDEDVNNAKKVVPLKGATVVIPTPPSASSSYPAFRSSTSASPSRHGNTPSASQGDEGISNEEEADRVVNSSPASSGGGVVREEPVMEDEMDAEERMTYSEWVAYRKAKKEQMKDIMTSDHLQKVEDNMMELRKNKKGDSPLVELPPVSGSLTTAERRAKQVAKEKVSALDRASRSIGLSHEDLALQERSEAVFQRRPASSFPSGVSSASGEVFVQRGTQKSEEDTLRQGNTSRVNVPGLLGSANIVGNQQQSHETSLSTVSVSSVNGVEMPMVDDAATKQAARHSKSLQGLKTSISNALSIRTSRHYGSAGLVRPSVRWENVLTHAAPFTFHIPQTFIPANGLRVMIFASKIDSCAAVYFTLRDRGYNVTLLHGSLPPSVRHDMIKRFASGESNIIVCTDIASRGLDLPVDVVINFDMPTSAVPFLARAGRTGRMGRKGACYSLYHKKRQVIIASALRVLINKGLSLNDVSNDGNHNTQARYGEWATKHKNMLAKAYVNIITRHRLPAKKIKAYVKHNAMWRPIWHPKGAHMHGGVPTGQQSKIMNNVMQDAIWYRRQQLARRKGGKAKFGGAIGPSPFSWKDGTHSGHVAEGGTIEQ